MNNFKVKAQSKLNSFFNNPKWSYGVDRRELKQVEVLKQLAERGRLPKSKRILKKVLKDPSRYFRLRGKTLPQKLNQGFKFYYSDVMKDLFLSKNDILEGISYDAGIRQKTEL